MRKAFKVTVEFICHNMIDRDELKESFDGDPYRAYERISKGFRISVLNFTDEPGKVVKVEIPDRFGKLDGPDDPEKHFL